MFPFPPIGNPISIFSGFMSSAVGWAWDKVVQGIFTWFAEGLLLLIEFVWSLLDTATTPRLTDDWFVNGVVASLAQLALSVTVAMMLMTAIQTALSGRPELALDSVGAAVRAIAGTAFTVIVMDTLIRFADVIADTVWVQARPNTREVLDGLVQGVLSGDGWGATFLGPLALLIGMIGMVVTTVLLFMRSALLYFVAAFAPLVWSTSVLPMMRGGVRRMVHIAVGLVLAKPAIVIALAIGMQLIASSPLAGDESDSEVVQVGTLLTGFAAFAVAAISPIVVYKLLPAAEGAAMASGIAGGWARSAMGVAQAAMLAKSYGASMGASAATRPVPSTGDRAGGSTGFGLPTGGGPGGSGGGGGGGFAAGGGSGPTGAAGGIGTTGAAATGPAAPVVATGAAAASTTNGSAASTGGVAAASTGGSAGRSASAGARSDRAGSASGERPLSARRVVLSRSAGSGRRDEEGER